MVSILVSSFASASSASALSITSSRSGSSDWRHMFSGLSVSSAVRRPARVHDIQSRKHPQNGPPISPLNLLRSRLTTSPYERKGSPDWPPYDPESQSRLDPRLRPTGKFQSRGSGRLTLALAISIARDPSGACASETARARSKRHNGTL